MWEALKEKNMYVHFTKVRVGRGSCFTAFYFGLGIVKLARDVFFRIMARLFAVVIRWVESSIVSGCIWAGWGNHDMVAQLGAIGECAHVRICPDNYEPKYIGSWLPTHRFDYL